MRFATKMLCVLSAVATFVNAGEEKPPSRSVWIAVPGERGLMRVDNPPEGVVPRDREAIKSDGLEHVSRSVNRELHDFARAMRSLDQSYAIRGFQGCGAATAGSVFIDWRAKGLRRPEGVAVLPPAPIVLGVPKRCELCPRCFGTNYDSETPCDCEYVGEATPTPLPPSPQSTPR